MGRARPGNPYARISVEYELKYGTGTLDIHEDALKKGDHVVIVDDLLATGVTAIAAARLVELLGGVVLGIALTSRRWSRTSRRITPRSQPCGRLDDRRVSNLEVRV